LPQHHPAGLEKGGLDMGEELKNLDAEMLHVESFYIGSLSAVWAELVSYPSSAIEANLFHSFDVRLVNQSDLLTFSNTKIVV